MTITIQNESAAVAIAAQMMGHSMKSVLVYMQSFARHYANVFPSYERIAEKCHCSVRTAKRSIKKFEELGWMAHRRRAYRSNHYFVSNSVILADLTNPQGVKAQFKKGGDGTICGTISNVTNSDKNILRNGALQEGATRSSAAAQNVLDRCQAQRAAMNYLLKKYCPSVKVNLTDKDIADLAKHFIIGQPQAVIVSVLEGLESAKITISNPIGWIFKMCKVWKRRYKVGWTGDS